MSNLEQPKESKKDAIIDILLATAVFEPTLGAIASALNLGHNYTKSKKMNDWVNLVAEKVNELTDDIELLKNNECFLESFYFTSKIALISDEDKQKNLINIIKNSLNGKTIEIDKRLHFFEILTYMNNSKIKVLKFLDNPQIDISNIYAGGLYSYLISTLKEFKNEEDFLNSILFDLENKGLVTENIKNSLKITTTAQSINNSRTTKLGKEFLNFIS